MKKIITKEGKLKTRILELEEKLRVALNDVSYYRGKYDGVKNEVQEKQEVYQNALRKFEGRVDPLFEENYWLKETLRLVIVPKGKEAELNKVNESERERKRKLGMF